MKNSLTLIILFFSNQLIGQEIVRMKDTYIDGNLVYKVVNDSLFNGISNHKRKNGDLVYEEEFKNGVILLSRMYFNGKKKRVSNKIIYNSTKPYVISKENLYNLESEVFRIITYNNDGVKILVEQFKKGKLIYSCQYSGKKKHGIELGYSESGELLIHSCEYKKGKKDGEELCTDKEGKKIIRKYKKGRRIK